MSITEKNRRLVGIKQNKKCLKDMQIHSLSVKMTSISLYALEMVHRSVLSNHTICSWEEREAALESSILLLTK
jgi:hypothetical protein